MKDIKKRYSNGQVTVIWQPARCIHSKECFRGLPEVFDPQKRPWVNIEGAESKRIIEQVKKCPSGALSYETDMYLPAEREVDETIVEVLRNGPLMVRGRLRIKDNRGTDIKSEVITAFCRCGGSKNKPYCDGTHKKIKFNDEN
jgi:uncharacterized Fe-S cluster protein YjdI